MKIQISKTPTIVLSISSILPILLIEVNNLIWAVTTNITLTFFAFWIYFVSFQITKKYYNKVKFNKVKFTMLLVASLFYIILLSVHFIFNQNDNSMPKVFLLFIILGNFFSFFSVTYLLLTFSKLIASAEQKDTSEKKENYIKYLIFLIFYPIGIWLLNPKIKHLLKS